jgi:hypothetical protein
MDGQFTINAPKEKLFIYLRLSPGMLPDVFACNVKQIYRLTMYVVS